MGNINGSINLLKYKDARKVSLQGVKGIFIPTEGVNPTIVVGEKGAYAHLRIVEKESTFENNGKPVTYTHFIAASIADKDKRAELKNSLPTEEFNGLTPILGNASEWKGEAAADYEEAEEDKPAASKPRSNEGADQDGDDKSDDLPF